MKTKSRKNKPHVVTLRGLPGVKQVRTRAVFVTSVTMGMEFVREGLAITCSGDEGALNVWKDDDGTWRCERHRFKLVASEAKFKYIAAVAQWLKDNFPVIEY